MNKALLLLLALLPVPLAGAESDGDEAASKDLPRAEAALTLSAERQRLAGLETARLATFELQSEVHAYGRVFEIKDLLALRARYRAALSELTIAEAQLKVAQKSYQRLSDLHRESIVATRDLIQSEAQLASERARCEGFRRNLREVREEALQTWGGELFRQAIEAESPLFDALLDRSRVLLLVSLPPAESSRPYLHVKISPSGDRQQARDATLVSAAPRTDETTQSETWFYSAPSAGLRSGMRLDVWLPRGDDRRGGVLIPLSAVVWHNGKPWAYVKSGGDTFKRRMVEGYRELGQSLFVERGFSAGEELVVTGGQTLLSEEMRPQIPAEDGDDD